MKFLGKKILILVFILIPSIGFTQLPVPPVLGLFATYDHQIGMLNSELIQFGGAHVGFTWNTKYGGIATGVGFYSNYPFTSENSFGQEKKLELMYGGLVLGYHSPIKVIGFRATILVGMGALRNNYDDEYTELDLSLAIAPSIFLDLHFWKGLTLSGGITYKYFQGIDAINADLNLNNWKNSLGYTISLGWVW